MNVNDNTKMNEKKWDGRSKTYNNKRFNYFRYIQKKVFKNIKINNGDNFLDIGCGTGWAVIYASKFIGDTGTSYGIDISGGMIKRAKENALKNVNIKLYQSDSKKIPLKDNHINVAICTNSFHHYVKPVEVLCEINRVLIKGSMIYILDPTRDSIIMEMINKRVTNKEKEHVKFYSSKEFEKLFKDAKLLYCGSKRILGPLKLHMAKKI